MSMIDDMEAESEQTVLKSINQALDVADTMPWHWDTHFVTGMHAISDRIKAMMTARKLEANKTLRTIVTIERDGLDVRVLTLTFEIPDKDFDIVAAAKAAATDYCMTEAGRNLYAGNCNQFNWADFDAEIPDAFCEKHGFKKVGCQVGDIDVNWDEHLVDDARLVQE